MAAAWIQFMVKDWLSHGAGDPQHCFEMPLAADDPWPQRPLRVLKTLPDPTRDGDDHGPRAAPPPAWPPPRATPSRGAARS